MNLAMPVEQDTPAETVKPLMEMRLVAIYYAATDINLYEFRRPAGLTLPGATAGAHVDLQLPNGVLRQYSLVNPDASPTSYVLGIKRDAHSRGGSKYVFDMMKVGQVVGISAPRNHFPLKEQARHSVFIAGGIGITPIWAMAQRLTELQRSWEMHYTCRTRDGMAFRDVLHGLDNVHLRFGSEQSEPLDLAQVVARAPEHSDFYCCGPVSMMEAFETATAQVPKGNVHLEYFAPKSAPDLTGGFVIELARSGRQVAVLPGQSILQALRGADVKVTSSCEDGVCGACEIRVLSGTPDHRDVILSEQEHAEGRTIMVCCSGSLSARLVLDL